MAIAIVALLMLAGCSSHQEPDLPSSTDSTAIAHRVISDPNFLRDITSARWTDDGRRAAELFAWIPRDAQSFDRNSAERAGKTAHAVASFLAENRDSVAGYPANPDLWQAYARSVGPYVGAMVGDAGNTIGFDPLDGPESQMQRTVSMFAAVAKNADAQEVLNDTAAALAHTHEVAFAKAVVPDALASKDPAGQRDLLLAARLRAIVATGIHLADPKSESFTPAHAQTELAFQIASLTARPNASSIANRFFKDGKLLPPNEVPDTDWSIYDTQLTIYLAKFPPINDAIGQFGRAYDFIATQP
jgi:hypothetical protein